MLDFGSFMAARSAVKSNPSISKYLTPIIFGKLTNRCNEKVRLSAVMGYLNSRIRLERMYVQAQLYDCTGKGFLREADLENFVLDMIPSLPGLRDLESEFMQFYVYTATRKLLVMLDPRKTGTLKIVDMLQSEVFEEFLSLRNDVAEQSTSWFAAPVARAIYSRYVEMDADADGMLSKSELMKYPGAVLPLSTVDRIFQECMTFGGLVDYKGYLDLVLALENPVHMSSIKYFWKLLDVNKTGRLDRAVVEPFLTAIFASLCVTLPQYKMYRAENIFQELLDMIGAADEFISFQDIVRHPVVGGTVLHILLDANAFYNHDNRENTLNTANLIQTS